MSIERQERLEIDDFRDCSGVGLHDCDLTEMNYSWLTSAIELGGSDIRPVE